MVTDLSTSRLRRRERWKGRSASSVPSQVRPSLANNVRTHRRELAPPSRILGDNETNSYKTSIPRKFQAAMEPTDASSPFRPFREPSLSSANWTATGASTSSSRDGAMVLRSGLQSSRRREEWSKWCMVSRATMVLPFASSVDAHLPLSLSSYHIFLFYFF